MLIAGGYGCTGTSCTPGDLDTAELYNPATETFSSTTSAMAYERYYHTATLLTSGQVLIAGGHGCTGTSCTPGDLDTAELYNPATGTFSSSTGAMTYARSYHTATLLNDGLVLMAGGLGCTGTSCPASYLGNAEVYNSVTGTFSFIASSGLDPRYQHAATMLNNGMVLIAGGVGPSGVLNSAELY